MERLLVFLFSGTLFACALAEPAGFWRFEEGTPSEAAKTVVPCGVAGVSEKGQPPAYDADVPFAQMWDSVAAQPAVQTNRASLRFRAPNGVNGAAPVGGEISVPGKDAALKLAGFTLEAFVKVAKQHPRHALVASKRRKGNAGACWSLSITPSGALGARFDTEQEKDGAKSGAFNQCMSGARVPDDGAWHHVALTVDGASLKASLYVDYQPGGGGTIAAPLVYDDSDFVIGRGLDGWLDEVRLTPEALHPEQFLRPVRFFSELKPKAASAVPLLDQTQTRVQSALKPELKKLGTLIPKRVPEIGTSTWSLGCETLDRDLANWDAYRGYLVPLGIKRIRLQGGWNRTEKKKGEYDFAWLDHIVDDAHSLGLQVCLETSYNNRLYEPGGATGPGGLLPAGEETLVAWDRWVETMARRYSAKGVKEWMMYNEPNLRKENTPELIVANNVRTAAIIKRVDPEARIGAFVLAGLNTGMISNMLVNIRQQGKLDLFTWAIYHGYSGNPDRLNGGMAGFNAMLAAIAPKIRPWQGEAGCASEEVQYALSGIDWTEYSHAKWNARRMLCDFGHGVESSVFCISDVSYSKDFISRYGLLKTNPDNSVIKVKTAYYAVQNVVSIFNDALERAPDCALAVAGAKTNLTCFAFRDKKSGLGVVTLWDGSEMPGNGSDSETVRVAVPGGRFKEPVWVDLITGVVYEIPAEKMTAGGGTVTFADIPVYDGPAAILDKSLVSFEPVKVVQKKTKKTAKRAAPAKNGEPPVAAHLLPGTQQPAPAVLIVGKTDEEAAALVKWLNAQDVHAFVVRGLGAGAAQAALRYVRNRAAEWQVKLDAVGVLGVGAGGAWAKSLADKGADFVAVIDAGVTETEKAAAGPKRFFIGAKDAWEKPLAEWLEPFKGKVF